MTLLEFKESKGMSYQELSDFLEIGKGTVINIAKGVGCITLVNAYRIMIKTKGAVGYVDLLTEMEDC